MLQLISGPELSPSVLHFKFWKKIDNLSSHEQMQVKLSKNPKCCVWENDKNVICVLLTILALLELSLLSILRICYISRFVNQVKRVPLEGHRQILTHSSVRTENTSHLRWAHYSVFKLGSFFWLTSNRAADSNNSKPAVTNDGQSETVWI